MPPKAERPTKGKAKKQISKKGLFDPKDHQVNITQYAFSLNNIFVRNFQNGWGIWSWDISWENWPEETPSVISYWGSSVIQ